MIPRRAAFLLLVGAVAAVAWLALAPVPVLARAWTTFLLIVLPALTIRQAIALRDSAGLPRVPVYISSIGALVIVAAITAAAAASARMPARELGLIFLPWTRAVAWAAGTTAAGVAFALLCHALGMRETPITLELLPRTRSERAGFAALSVAAGVCEEFIYRGFLIATLALATGSATVAALVAAVAFGLVHGYQAPGGIARAAVLGMLLTAPVIATGSLVPAVLAHAAYDLLLGLVLADRLRA